jgi:signal transduction histidine kinase
MGQLLSKSRLARMRERTEVDMAWSTVDAITGSGPDAIFETETSVISARKTLADIHGRPLLVLQTESPRSISSLGSQTITVATLFFIVAGALVCGFIWFMLSYTILRPIEKLTTHIDEIRASGDLSRQLSMDRADEIGVLGRQFDNMTADVHDARQALLDQSFKAGKADTAAEVMHNIRNAMTPMVNGLERLRKSFKVAGNLRVAEATQQIASDECPLERKEKFLEYIVASFERVEVVGTDAIRELDVVTAQAKQVAGILSEQERFANVAPLAEDLIIDDLLVEAGNVIPKENPLSVELTLDDSLNDLRIRAHRIGLLQVMGNLILNAYESIKRSGEEHGQIALRATGEVVDDQAMVRVTVRDNGGGFDKTTSAQIFQRGFTSKTKGSTTGLGLHWCANAVASMGGKISAESTGAGYGAEFHVLLPAARGG